MCDFEEFVFTCGHNALDLKDYCHQSRNHPRHECNNVKRLRNSWYQGRPCNNCANLVNGTSSASGSSSRGNNRKEDPRGPFIREDGEEHHWS